MTDYPTTWWEQTDDYGPFIHNVSSPIYRNLTTGEKTSELPVGALFVAHRLPGKGPDEYPACGHDGLAIVANCIDGRHWYIDGRASNCTMKDDNKHRCWVRHGTVGDKLTVDKNGLTCKAGAGSFYMGYDFKTEKHSWHGFLQDGVMVRG